MAYKHFTNAVEQEIDFGNPNERYVYLEASYRADRKGIVRMSQSEIAEVTLLSPRTIASVFDMLERRKLMIRIGHGRYQVAPPSEDHETAQIIQRARQWVQETYPDTFEDGEISILETDLPHLPQFIKEATTRGYLVEIGRSKVIMSEGKTESVIHYSLHL